MERSRAKMYHWGGGGVSWVFGEEWGGGGGTLSKPGGGCRPYLALYFLTTCANVFERPVSYSRKRWPASSINAAMGCLSTTV